MEHISHIHPSLAAAANEVLPATITLARMIAGLILIILLILSLSRSVLLSSSLQSGYSPFLRGLVIVFVLSVYGELTGILSGGLSAIIDYPTRPPDFLQSLENMALTELADDPEEIERRAQQTRRRFINFPAIIMSWIQQGVTFVVRYGISLIRSFLLAFLYIIGPLALALSLIPGFSGTALSWLRSFIAIQFWELTLNLLDTLVYSYNQHFLDYTGDGAGRFLHAAAANLVIIFLYLITPSLSNYLISTGASSVWGKFSSLVGTALLFSRKSKILTLKK